jgi:tetratricopeptide (TPR) repeat protein
VLELQSAVLPASDPDLLVSRRVLARTLTLDGQWFAAERVLRETVQIQERDRPADWRLAVTLRSALVDAQIGRMASPDTAQLCREILELQQRHLGPDHPDVAATLDRLAGALQRMLRWDEALAVARRALELRRRVQGDQHPLTGEAWSRLALMHDRLHHTSEAIESSRRAHAIFEASLGAGHPKTLAALHRVGSELLQTGRLREAEPIHRRVLAGYREGLGEEHPSTLRVLRHLQKLLVADSRLGEARAIGAQMRHICERIVGRPDADLETLNDYADYLLIVEPRDLRDPWRALALAEHGVLATKRRAPLLLRTLGLAQRDTGRPDLAIATLQEALALPDGVRSWTTAEIVVDLLNTQGRENEVVGFLTGLMDRQRAARGEHDFLVAKTERLLALQHARLDHPADAERWFRAALARYRASRPDTDWEVGRAKSELGGCLLARGAVVEAAPLLRDGLRTLQADPSLHGHRVIEEAKARAARLPS